MAYQFTDGFDSYNTIGHRWETTQGTPTFSSASARFPGSGGVTSQGISLSTSQFIRKNLSGNQVTIIVGAALKITNAPTGVGTSKVISLMDNTASQITLSLSPSGVFQFYRGTPATNPIGASSSNTFTFNVWHFLEIKVLIDPTVGTVELRIDGNSTPWIASTGLNTRSTANTFANQVQLGDETSNLGPTLWDDVYMLDGTTGSLNNFLGDRRIITPVPSGAGDFTNFAHTGAATNWQAVSEIPPDDDTSYVSDSVVTDRDSYAMQTVTFNGTADFIVPWVRIRKDDPGVHTVNLTSRKASTDTLSSAITVPSSYADMNAGVMTTCGDGTSLTASNLNSNQIGIKIAS